MEKIGDVAMPGNTGDFRLLSRRVLTELAKLRESHVMYRGLVPWIGFPQTQITYNRGDRLSLVEEPIHLLSGKNVSMGNVASGPRM
jgi:dolichol-phosphate mannosyltransferase